MNKKELRKHIREVKQTHSAEECDILSERLCQQVLLHDKVIEADTVICFWSMSDEVNTHQLVAELSRRGKRVLLPKVISDSEMTLHEFRTTDDLRPGAYGIMEPATPAIALASIPPTAICITPGMAFTTSGKRLGRGKGYYDRLFQQLPNIKRIGICYPFQIVPDLPTDPHDMPMSDVIII